MTMRSQNNNNCQKPAGITVAAVGIASSVDTDERAGSVKDERNASVKRTGSKRAGRERESRER
jgi:hypothetical protein